MLSENFIPHNLQVMETPSGHFYSFDNFKYFYMKVK